MRREEVINRLKESEGAIRAFGVTHIHLYGLHVRDQARPDSDVDLFLDRDGVQKFGLIELARL